MIYEDRETHTYTLTINELLDISKACAEKFWIYYRENITTDDVKRSIDMVNDKIRLLDENPRV